MTVRNIKKNLAGAEDLLHGIGVETQSRGGAFYNMHKLDTYVPTYDVTEMQRSSLTFMRLYGTDTAYTDYRRNPTGTIGIPSDLGGVWEPIRSSELPVCGNFIHGAYVFSSDCVVGYNDSFMQWQGSLPKVVPAGSTPATSGGIGAGAWVDRSDVTLRDLQTILTKRYEGRYALADIISVLDFGATGDCITDDSDAFQAALDYCSNISATLYIPTPLVGYRVTKQLNVGYASIHGSGVVVSSPYTSPLTLTGCVFYPEGIQGNALFNVDGHAKNKLLIKGFGIDMSKMSAGTTSGVFDVDTMTKGIYINNRHSVDLEDIEVINVPSNATGFAWRSAMTGGCYWGNHKSLGCRSKLSQDNDITAKGFVLVGVDDDITAQNFNNCTSYRGWYLKNTHTSVFTSCHAEGCPEHGVYIDGGKAITFIGGFYEDCGTETSDTCYEFYGINSGNESPKRVTIIGATIMGNGVGGGISKEHGYIRLNSGHPHDNGIPQQLGHLVIDPIGNVNQPTDTAITAYSVNHLSTVASNTTTQLFFNTVIAGFDIANEYNNVYGVFRFKTPADFNGGLVATYLLHVQLEVEASDGAAIAAGTRLSVGINGTSTVSPLTITAFASGKPREIITGSALIRVAGADDAQFTLTFNHNAGKNLHIVNNGGEVSTSYVTLHKAT